MSARDPTRTAAASTARTATPRTIRSRIARGLAITLLSLAALAAAYTWITLNWSYSSGEHAGVLQKFSRKGWICKTYEGEIASSNSNGVAPQVWRFTVRDAALAEKMPALVGRSVRLRYTEHIGVPTSCFGDTGYFVEGFEFVGG